MNTKRLRARLADLNERIKRGELDSTPDPSERVCSALLPYIFRRAGGWYVIELANDEDARENAECNVGTVTVEDMNGRQVWPTKPPPSHSFDV